MKMIKTRLRNRPTDVNPNYKMKIAIETKALKCKMLGAESAGMNARLLLPLMTISYSNHS